MHVQQAVLNQQHSIDLPSNRQVFVAIGSSVEDFAENLLADASATFMSADEDHPTLSSSSPTDGQVGVDINADLVLTFSEAVDAESGNIEIRRTSDGVLFESRNGHQRFKRSKHLVPDDFIHRFVLLGL